MADPEGKVPAPEAGGPAADLEQQALALGLGPEWLRPLLDRVGPVLARVLLQLLEGYVRDHPALTARAGPGDGAGPGEVDHARCCDLCLEHLVAAAAVCLHHRRACEREPPP